jgi:hypothetical protein
MVHFRGVRERSLLMLVGLGFLVGLLLWPGEGRQTPIEAAACWKAEITHQWDDLDLAGSILRVSVQGKTGLPVTVRSRGSFQTVGFTGTKPEYGPFVAEFAPLSRSTYFIEPQGLDYVFEVWLNGTNYTRVEFVPLPCAPTATPTPRPATPTPRPQAAATAPRRPVATITPVPPPVQPSQPTPLWQGRVVQHIRKLEGRYFATIAVRVIGRPAGQQVEIRSDGWSETCTTGTKPEYGPDACEFGALNTGTYRLTPKELGTHLDIAVDLQDFVEVEFHYTGPPPRTRWIGSVVKNTSGEQATDHTNSAIAVIVAGRPWHEVEIRSNGWSTTAETGYKPEYGSDACEFGGLRASTYTIIPKGLKTSLQVTVDGWGWAMVRFDEVALPAPRSPGPSPQPTVPVAQPQGAVQAPEPGPTASPWPSPTPLGAGWKGWLVSNSSGDGERTGISSTIVVRVLNWPGVPVTVTAGGDWSATCTTGTKPEYGPDACEFGGLWPSTYRLRPEGANVEVEVTMDGLGVAFVEFAAP